MASSSSASVEDKRWLVLTVVCLVLALSLPSFVVRGYFKLQARKAITVDDWTMLFAGALWIGYIVCQIAACANGFGAHTKDLPKNTYYYLVGTSHNGDVVEALRFWYICTLLYVLTTTIIRISVGLAIWQYATSRPQRWIAISATTTATLANIPLLFLLLFQCTPISAFWSRNRADAASSCSHTTTTTSATWFAITATSTAANLTLAALPATALLKRGLPWRKRAAIAVLTIFAAAASTTSALQIPQVPALTHTADLTYSASTFAMLALLTPSLGLVGANLATLGPWFKELGWGTSAAVPSSTWGRRRGRAVAAAARNNVVRGGEEVDEAVLDAAVREGMARLEAGR